MLSLRVPSRFLSLLTSLLYLVDCIPPLTSHTHPFIKCLPRKRLNVMWSVILHDVLMSDGFNICIRNLHHEMTYALAIKVVLWWLEASVQGFLKKNLIKIMNFFFFFLLELIMTSIYCSVMAPQKMCLVPDAPGFHFATPAASSPDFSQRH